MTHIRPHLPPCGCCYSLTTVQLWDWRKWEPVSSHRIENQEKNRKRNRRLTKKTGKTGDWKPVSRQKRCGLLLQDNVLDYFFDRDQQLPEAWKHHGLDTSRPCTLNVHYQLRRYIWLMGKMKLWNIKKVKITLKDISQESGMWNEVLGISSSDNCKSNKLLKQELLILGGYKKSLLDWLILEKFKCTCKWKRRSEQSFLIRSTWAHTSRRGAKEREEMIEHHKTINTLT